MPIESITIGAGVPSPDKADEIILQCQEAGLLFLAFKPGSTQAIYQVHQPAALLVSHP
jgi:enoyl reductase-like protein